MALDSRPPVHESLSVVNSDDIYRNDEWWKSVVRYQFDQSDDHEEVAVYLWHDDDGWTRKNKYVIKTRDAWETDRKIIDRLFTETSPSSADAADYPVSDYYELDGGETVFESDDWWKAILRISQKGSYETQEVMVYLWQNRESEWRRRQKFTLKNQERWEKEKKVVESLVDDQTSTETDSTPESNETMASATETDESATLNELEELEQQMDDHLSGTFN